MLSREHVRTNMDTASMPQISNTLQTASAITKIKITLGLLNAIHECSDLFQRSMAKDLGIALGLANHYLERCIKEGFLSRPNRHQLIDTYIT